jgi:PIF1 helicase.
MEAREKFIINVLLAKVRFDEKKITLAVASSDIAATLLEGGRTAHSTFKLPLMRSHAFVVLQNKVTLEN